MKHFHTQTYLKIHKPLPENLGVSDVFLADVNKDGIRDLIFSGGVHYPEAAITNSLAGWVKVFRL